MAGASYLAYDVCTRPQANTSKPLEPMQGLITAVCIVEWSLKGVKVALQVCSAPRLADMLAGKSAISCEAIAEGCLNGLALRRGFLAASGPGLQEIPSKHAAAFCHLRYKVLYLNTAPKLLPLNLAGMSTCG